MPPTPSPTPLLVELSGSQSSFWDSSLFVGLLTLAGVALGAWLSYLFGRRQEERKAERESEQRWDVSVRELTAQLANDVDALINTARSTLREHEGRQILIADGLLKDDGVGTIEEIYSHTKVYEAIQRVTRTGESLDLIAPQTLRPTINALRITSYALLIASERADIEKQSEDLFAFTFELKEKTREHFGLNEKRPSRSAPGS